MVRKSVRQQEALRRARERQRAHDIAQTQPTDETRRPMKLPNRALTEADHRRIAADTCGWCGGPIEYKPRGRIPKWCSAGCRQRAWEQTRAAESGRSAVQVVERRVEIPIEKPAAPPRTPRHTEWIGTLHELAKQLDRGDIYDRDLPDLTVALNQVLASYERHPSVRARSRHH
ncbi:hypothetical protein SAMN05444157_1329 [Frankineae bacterium MT45]|nr:hypothetical protein SAMN05444157_1329 [Frankineae bacterium MT45]